MLESPSPDRKRGAFDARVYAGPAPTVRHRREIERTEFDCSGLQRDEGERPDHHHHCTNAHVYIKGNLRTALDMAESISKDTIREVALFPRLSDERWCK